MLRPGISLKDYLSPERVGRLYELGSTPPWLKITTNNFGFFDAENFPYFAKDGNELIVGIFGGSVAHWFAVQGAEKFSELLANNPKFSGKKIKILNFAAGGFKEPQQLIVLNYFLSRGQKLDLVINIDGFNEIALSDKNISGGISPFMPSVQHMGPLVSLLKTGHLEKNYIASTLNVIELKDLGNYLRTKRDFSSFASLYLIYDCLYLYYQHKYQNAQLVLDSLGAKADENSIVWLEPSTPTSDFSTTKDQIIENWYQSSQLIYLSLKEKGIPYLHVLQPNQYVSQKKFDSQEELIARGPGSPYKVEAIQTGFKKMQSRSEDLRKTGVPFFDATPIFDGVKKITFSDNCCHFNQYGNELFAEAIAKNLD